MAKKPIVSTISSGYYSTTQLNSNFEALRDAFDNTVSRDGSIPNTMAADFDLNGNDVLNSNVINAKKLVVNGTTFTETSVDSVIAANVKTDQGLNSQQFIDLSQWTIAELLADISLAPSVGTILDAAGHRYEVKPAGTTKGGTDGYHLATAGGVLLRVMPASDGSIDLAAWGADPDMSVVLTEAQAMKGTGFGTTIYMPPGSFSASGTLVINRPIRLVGAGSGIAEFDPHIKAGSIVTVPAGVVGLEVASGGNWALIENLCLKAGGYAGFASGVVLKRRAQLNYVSAHNFSGHGFEIVGEGSQNVNLFRLDYCDAYSCGGDGLFEDGADANAGTIIGFNATYCKGWGIRDSSFLGNHHYGCHVAECTGAYCGDDPNSAGSFIGCYAEAGQWDILPNYVVDGGSNSHWAMDGGARRAGAIYAEPNATGVGRINITAFGSGYTSDPTVTVDAPTGYATATAVATVVDGEITEIRMDPFGKGAGYSSTPTVTISDPTGTGASAYATIAKPLYNNLWGEVQKITVKAGGSGYTDPTVSIAAPAATTATATAVRGAGGGISHIIVDNIGAGYTAVPGVTISGGGGTGATASAVLSRSQTHRIERVNGRNSIQQWRNSAVATGATNEFTRLGYADGNSGDVSLAYQDNASSRYLYLTGPRTKQKYGRAATVPYMAQFPQLVLSDRVLGYASSKPTSTDHANGEFRFNRNATKDANGNILQGWMFVGGAWEDNWVSTTSKV